MAGQASKSLFTSRTNLQTGKVTTSENTHSKYPKHTTLKESALVFIGVLVTASKNVPIDEREFIDASLDIPSCRMECVYLYIYAHMCKHTYKYIHILVYTQTYT
jgi:hypothetical protein